jgi:uncharacterized membrane protein
MNGPSLTLIIVGIFLILVGVVLLVIKVQTSESEAFKPIFQGPGRIMVSGPVGLVVIVIGVFCLIISAGIFKTAESGNPASSPTQSSMAPSPHRILATLTSPADGTRVSKSQGFTASGTTTYLGSETIWILDSSSGYTVDQEAVVTGGRWSAVDQPLGDSSDHLPFGLTMVATLANPACAAKLTKISNTRNDFLAHLPAGCKPFGQVTVSVAKR